ncbi:MAG: hypothetical protein NTX85_01160 [Candidatus Nomurabacteria bacterium]|nr:hypothetical protein [Candidatus Nomurabacteria bacterium]
MSNVHKALEAAIDEGVDGKDIIYYTRRNGVNKDILPEFTKGECQEKYTYYLSFDKKKGNSNRRIKAVLDYLLKIYNTHFLGGGRYYFSTQENVNEKIVVYVFGKDNVIFHFFVAHSIDPCNYIFLNHQNINFERV